MAPKSKAALAAAAAEEGEKTHVVLHPVRHNGKYNPRHSLMTLADEDADELEALGVVKPIATPLVPVREADSNIEG